MANYVGQCKPEILRARTRRFNQYLMRDEFPTLGHATNENFTTTKTSFSGKEAMLAFSFALRGLVFCTTSCKPDLKLEKRVYCAWWCKCVIGEQGRLWRNMIFWIRIQS